MFRRNLPPDLHSYIPKMEAVGSFELLTQFYRTAVIFIVPSPIAQSAHNKVKTFFILKTLLGAGTGLDTVTQNKFAQNAILLHLYF